MPGTQTPLSEAKRAIIKTRAKTAKSAAPKDAIALLKADHREVEELFSQFETARGAARKEKIAQQICTALKVHTQIEEEIFYPACMEDGVEADVMNEAEVEHDGAKKLIEEIEGSDPSDELYDARVHVLSEMIKHHVREEEQRGGMFAQAKDAGLDLKALGDELMARKEELMAEM